MHHVFINMVAVQKLQCQQESSLKIAVSIYYVVINKEAV